MELAKQKWLVKVAWFNEKYWCDVTIHADGSAPHIAVKNAIWEAKRTRIKKGTRITEWRFNLTKLKKVDI